MLLAYLRPHTAQCKLTRCRTREVRRAATGAGYVYVHVHLAVLTVYHHLDACIAAPIPPAMQRGVFGGMLSLRHARQPRVWLPGLAISFPIYMAGCFSIHYRLSGPKKGELIKRDNGTSPEAPLSASVLIVSLSLSHRSHIYGARKPFYASRCPAQDYSGLPYSVSHIPHFAASAYSTTSIQPSVTQAPKTLVAPEFIAEGKQWDHKRLHLNQRRAERCPSNEEVSDDELEDAEILTTLTTCGLPSLPDIFSRTQHIANTSYAPHGLSPSLKNSTAHAHGS
ncbi:hypothetical protein NM688_g3302 [Phlebia brevispora]|uniref:Uncharacterized protein n=1 Tax=Phlebia brevispora TaxID=194682 RepID=A0ACC1T6B7_9APHY|nr:hypothetical protein NM688_g3302 [Phlebia brevispora]